jgi:transposase InsO family protein
VALPPAGTPGKAYGPEEKAQALRVFSASGQGMRAWCARQGLSTATLCAWRRAYVRGGLEALAPRANPRNRHGASSQRHYSPEERRATIAAYQKSGMSQVAFSQLWGLSATSLGRWLRAYRAHGPKGLEAPWGGGRRGRKKEPVAESVREEIVATKRRFPAWGLRRIRDALARFSGLRVGTHKVREVVREAGLETPKPVKKARRAPPKVRRFERSRPRELWQSDITSYVLTRHSQRVYLTVFLDDHSRYVVSWALALQQRSELVTECLLEGLARFGKPKEVLTDQGRQYFAWRGKSRFQKLLIREGIEHVVARAHHPQTLGKCERLWQTVGTELWARARPQDLDEARRRLGHFFDHYNHFRPHQGIGGLVPADRFFGAERAVREEIERRMEQNALRLALGDPPRREVLLYGQIDGERVALYGERGRLVIKRPGKEREEIEMAALGAPGGRDEHERREEPRRRDERERVRAQAAGEASSAHALGEGGASGAGDAGAVGGGESRAAGERARERGGDARVLGGDDLEVRGGREDGSDAVAGVADESDGDFGDGVWPARSAALQEGAEREPDRSRERPEDAEEARDAARARARGGQAADRPLEDAAWAPAARVVDAGEVEEAQGAQDLEGLEERGARVATGGLPGPARSGSGEPRRDEEAPDSIAWWESAWGERFDEWERDEERGR